MNARARNTDPVTSHEAADGIDLMRSQMLVLTFCHQYMGAHFTDKGLVSTYRRVLESGETTSFPPLADSRIRTARFELAAAGLVHFAGYTKGTARRERIWTLDPALAKAGAPSRPRADRTRYERERRQGIHRSIPSAKVGAHLNALLEAGWTYTALAAHLGYDRGNLRNIATGRNQWTGVLMAEDILSVEVTS